MTGPALRALARTDSDDPETIAAIASQPGGRYCTGPI
jgi:hypothetical protein